MSFVIHDLKLIPQQNTMSCWYASAMMLVEWKRSRALMTLRDHPDPSQTRPTVAWEVAANGLTNPEILRMAALLGLKRVPPMSVPLDHLRSLLMEYGPLWTNGKTHIVVIAGVDLAKGTVLVYDPWPPRTGKVEWRSYSDWYLGNKPSPPGAPDSSRDTSTEVDAVFLYHP